MNRLEELAFDRINVLAQEYVDQKRKLATTMRELENLVVALKESVVVGDVRVDYIKESKSAEISFIDIPF